MRTIPPDLLEEYSEQREQALWEAAVEILRCDEGQDEDHGRSRRIAQLPAPMGGLGLRSTVRGRHAAYWASWADAHAMVKARNPAIAQLVVDSLEAGDTNDCLSQLQRAASKLDNAGFDGRPSWRALADGLRPSPPPPTEQVLWLAILCIFHFRIL